MSGKTKVIYIGGGSGGVTADSTVTLTNKRITRRKQTIADAATVTFNFDTGDIGVQSAVSNNTTLAAPTHTDPQDGDRFEWIVTSSSGAGKTLAINAVFGSSLAVSADLPWPSALSGNSLQDRFVIEYDSSGATAKYRLVGRVMGIVVG